MKNIAIINGPTNDDLFNSLRFSDKNLVEFVIKIDNNSKEKIAVRIIEIGVAHKKDGHLDEGDVIIHSDEDSLPQQRHKWTIKMFIRHRYNVKISVIPSDEWIEYTANYSTNTKKGVIIMSGDLKRRF